MEFFIVIHSSSAIDNCLTYSMILDILFVESIWFCWSCHAEINQVLACELTHNFNCIMHSVTCYCFKFFTIILHD